jgi:hypothetical protein
MSCVDTVLPLPAGQREEEAVAVRRKRPEATAAELLAIGRRCAGTLKGEPVDHADLLYDDRGLPR